MFSLRDLRFVLCSLDLNFLRAQRIMGFFLNYPQINGVGVSDHVVTNSSKNLPYLNSQLKRFHWRLAGIQFGFERQTGGMKCVKLKKSRP